MDMLKAARNNLFLKPLATFDGCIGCLIPTYLVPTSLAIRNSVVQGIANVTLAKLATTALQLTKKWTFTRISDRTTSYLLTFLLFAALSLTNSARQRIEAASSARQRIEAASNGSPRSRRRPPSGSNDGLSKEAQKLYDFLLLIRVKLEGFTYAELMNENISWENLLAAAEKIRKESQTTLAQVFNQLDSQNSSLPWAILTSERTESNEKYHIIKGLLEKGADLSPNIDKGFNSLLDPRNIEGLITLFKLIKDSSFEGNVLEKIKTIWNGKKLNKKKMSDFLLMSWKLEKDMKDFIQTIFDHTTGEWK